MKQTLVIICGIFALIGVLTVFVNIVLPFIQWASTLENRLDRLENMEICFVETVNEIKVQVPCNYYYFEF